MFEWILDFLFPPVCPVCGRYIESRDCWCEGCLVKLLQPRRLPLEDEMYRLLDGGVWALGVYEAELRGLLRRLKYDGRRSLLGGLHRYIAAGLKEIPALKESQGWAAGDGGTVAVPVPLHPDKQKERGFNQSELLFRQPLADINIIMEPVLIRSRFTKPQFGLTADERRENVQGAFAAASGADLTGKRVIIVDDIMTTGATLLECARAAQGAGAASIMGITAASGRR